MFLIRSILKGMACFFSFNAQDMIVTTQKELSIYYLAGNNKKKISKIFKNLSKADFLRQFKNYLYPMERVDVLKDKNFCDWFFSSGVNLRK